MAKQQVKSPVNLWFRSVSRGNRKSCPECRSPLAAGEVIWAWGEYTNGKRRNIKDFCKKCFHNVLALANRREDVADRGLEINTSGEKRPPWMSLVPPYPPELQLFMESCEAARFDPAVRQVAADACEEKFDRMDLAGFLRLQAQALIWGGRAGADLRQFFAISRDDWHYGRAPVVTVPWVFFLNFPEIKGILIANGAPHLYGLECVIPVDDMPVKGKSLTHMAPTPWVFLDNGGWHRQTDQNLFPVPVNYCYFVKPFPDRLKPPEPSKIVYPRRELDPADDREPVRVWRREAWVHPGFPRPVRFRFELYDMDDNMPGSSHRRVGYRLYANDSLRAHAFDIGCPPFGQLASDDSMLSAMRWAVRDAARDAVKDDWEDSNVHVRFSNMVHDLTDLYAEFNNLGGIAWRCPANTLRDHSVVDCETCYHNYAKMLADAENAQHAQPM